MEFDMVLTSQAPQPGARQLHMISRRRRPRKWPWIMVVLLVGVFLLYRFITADGNDSTQPPDGEVIATASMGQISDPTYGTNASPPDSTRHLRTADLPLPPRSLTTEPPAPAHGSITRKPQTSSLTPQTFPDLYVRGMDLLAQGQLVEGRAVLSRLLFDDDLRLRPADAQTVRDTLTSINEKIIFDKVVLPNDPVATEYQIQSGDVLSRISPNFHIPAAFIQQINRVAPRRLHVGQKLKIIRGPFHVRVIKHDYRLDLYLKDDMGDPLYVMSMPVGLGETNSTPVGHWIFEPGRKVKNPGWRNPRPPHEYYAPNDPNNPIGEYWLAIKGTDPTTEDLTGYGIHGTIDAQSIGIQASMGCIRLRDDDIQMIFNMIWPGQSTLQILP